MRVADDFPHALEHKICLRDGIEDPRALDLCAEPAIVQKIVYELAHLPRRIEREREILMALFVELRSVLLHQERIEGQYHSQVLLQIVRRRIGEVAVALTGADRNNAVDRRVGSGS